MIALILKNRWLKFGLLLNLVSICFLLSTAVLFLFPSQQVPVTHSLHYESIAALLYGGTMPAVTNDKLHGLDGYLGYDYKRGCGSSLYSPVPGWGVISYVGYDGYKHENRFPENSMIVIKGPAGKATLFHGTYTAQVGDLVIGGETIIGIEDQIGWATGCHSHLVWEPNYNHKPLRISWYDPARCAIGESINCDSDPTKFATMITVRPHHYGKVAACPESWTRARRMIVIPGMGTYQCLDTGGAIVETDRYIWIDLLLKSPPPEAGSLVYGWYFENDLTK